MYILNYLFVLLSVSSLQEIFVELSSEGHVGGILVRDYAYKNSDGMIGVIEMR